MLSAAAAVIGYLLWLRARDKRAWIGNRLATERLRQLFFQFPAYETSLAARAIADDEALREYQNRREVALNRLVASLRRNPATHLARLDEDAAGGDHRIEGIAADDMQTIAPSPALDRLLATLRSLRLRGQEDYIRSKTDPGYKSPATRAKAVKILTEVMTLAVLTLTVVAGAVVLIESSAYGPWVDRLIFLIGVLSMLALGLRVFDDALQFRTDTDRYEWYLATVTSMNASFERADTVGRIAILREFERVSYQEMRAFIRAVMSARFIL